jgi:iron(III) transport system substrate-binding protein
MGNETNNGKKDHWFRDWLRHGASSWFSLVPVILILVLFTVLGVRWKSESDARTRHLVVIYAAQDQVYAEPILRDFEKETGIKIRAVYDSEAVKTVGLANRLLAERRHPQCDVFWGNEEMRTRQLATEGVFEQWTAFGHRSRQFVVNTNHVQSAMRGTPSVPAATHHAPRTTGRLPAPSSLLELTNAHWRGKVALAYPLFGTTATHFLALRQHWGEEGWLAWCRALAANDALVVDGNSVVVKLVGRGEVWIGLTDSDDIAAGQREGLPVATALMEETLHIPNTVAIVQGAPHREAAGRLFAHLRSAAVAGQLVAGHALQGAEPMTGQGLQPDWDELLRRLEADTQRMKEVFLR